MRFLINTNQKKMKKDKMPKKEFILFLNASKEKELDVFLLQKNQIYKRQNLKEDFKVSENLLKLIDKLLKKNTINLNQLKGIIAVSGPGPFTSIRISAVVANTLAFALKIPVVGIPIKNKNISEKELINLGLKKLKQARIGDYIHPFYNQEPNITKAKR